MATGDRRWLSGRRRLHHVPLYLRPRLRQRDPDRRCEDRDSRGVTDFGDCGLHHSFEVFTEGVGPFHHQGTKDTKKFLCVRDGTRGSVRNSLKTEAAVSDRAMKHSKNLGVLGVLVVQKENPARRRKRIRAGGKETPTLRSRRGRKKRKRGSAVFVVFDDRRGHRLCFENPQPCGFYSRPGPGSGCRVKCARRSGGDPDRRHRRQGPECE